MAKYKKHLYSAKIATLVGKQTVIMGDLTFTGGLHVEGKVVGNVIADPDSRSLLVLSEAGQIDGEVRVPNVVLNGTVVGDVTASRHLELASNANVQGNIFYQQMEMAIGAKVSGRLVHQVGVESFASERDLETGEAPPEPETGARDSKSTQC